LCYLIVLHIDIALDIALGAMLLLFLVMIIGMALIGEFLDALGISSVCTSFNL
jgi:hypothetical protein